MLAHDVTGDGPAALLLHSSVADRRMWDPQVRPLADAGYQVVRCDFRGFGDTPAGRFYRDADDVRDLLDGLGIGSAHVVGSSMGGRVAQELAARRPERVDTLVLLCPGMKDAPTTPDILEFVREEDELLARGELDRVAELYVRLFVGPEADERARVRMRGMRRHSLDVQNAFGTPPRQPEVVVDLGLVSTPTVVVSGAYDLRYFQDIAEVLAARITGARHIRLPWAGHLPGVERPAAITELLLDVWARSTAQGAPPGPGRESSDRPWGAAPASR